MTLIFAFPKLRHTMDDIIDSPPRSPVASTSSTDQSSFEAGRTKQPHSQNRRLSLSFNRDPNESMHSLDESAIGEICERGDALQLSMSSLRKILQHMRKQIQDRDTRIAELEEKLRKSTEGFTKSKNAFQASETEKNKLLSAVELSKAAVADLEREMQMWKRRVDVAEASQASTSSLLEQTRDDFDILSKELASLRGQEHERAQSIVLSLQAPLREEMDSLRRKTESLRKECGEIEQLRREALQRASEDAGAVARKQMERECGALVPAGEVIVEKRRVTQLQEDLHVAHLSNMRLLQLLASVAEELPNTDSPIAEFARTVLHNSKTTLLTLMGSECCGNCGEDIRLGVCTCRHSVPPPSSISGSVFIPSSSASLNDTCASRWAGTGIPSSNLYSGTFHDPRSKGTRTSNQLLRNAEFDGNKFIEAVSTTISRQRAESQKKRGGKRPANEADVALVSDATLQEMKYFVSRGTSSKCTKRRAHGGSVMADTVWLRSLVNLKSESDYWIPHGTFVAAQAWRDHLLSAWRDKHGDTMFATVAEHFGAERFFPLFLSMNKIWRARAYEKIAHASSTHPSTHTDSDTQDAKVMWKLVQEKLRSTVSINSSTMRVATMYDEVVATCLQSLEDERRRRRKLEAKCDALREADKEGELIFLRGQLDTLSDSVTQEGDDLRKSVECTCLDVHHFLDVAEDSLLCDQRRDDPMVAGFGRVLEFVREFVDEVSSTTKAAASRIHKHTHRTLPSSIELQ